MNLELLTDRSHRTNVSLDRKFERPWIFSQEQLNLRNNVLRKATNKVGKFIPISHFSF